MIWNVNEILLLIVAIVSFIIATECGFRFGHKNSQKENKDLAEHISSLQGAILGLLALLLGFTFSMSIERFDLRKQLVLEEANSIGTTYLRSKLLPAEFHDDAATLFSEYVESRLDFYYARNDAVKLEDANKRSSDIERLLWDLAIRSAQKTDPPIFASLFIQSLNDVIDTNEKRRVALENHVPEAVIFLLFFVSVFGMGFIGYNYGLAGKRRHSSTIIFILLISSVLTIILDIDRPRRGFIQVSQASLERLQADIQKDINAQ